MVCSGERESKFMAMGPERSKPLHNFTLPYLKWGNQKYLRCMKVDGTASAAGAATAAAVSAAADHRHRRRSSPEALDASPSRSHNLRDRRLRVTRPRNGGEAEGIEAVREKIMKDLKTAADKMKDAILREEVSDGEEEEEEEEDEEFEEAKQKLKEKERKAKEKEKEKEKEREESPATEAEVRPWNLRTRRAACKAPIGEVGGANNKGLRIEDRKTGNNNNITSYSPMRNETAKSPRVRERGALLAAAEEKKERAKFSVALSRKEIEEDFRLIAGHRPPRRPKKRPRIVQKQTDMLFPGLWLTEVTADAYKVPEAVENGKR